MKKISVYNLEDYMIPFNDWDKSNAPKEALEILKDGGGPVGLVNHPIYGWFVLGTGQGPCVLWSEKNYKWNYDESCIEV